MLTESLPLDPLTGALSRSALQGRLDGEIERAVRLGAPLVLCIIDLDYFKSINDAFGHRRGDLVLEGFAARAHACLRQADALFRYGGDEFVLLLPDTDQAGAKILLDRLVTAANTTACAVRTRPTSASSASRSAANSRTVSSIA